jgi:hypothetical protein
MKNSWSAGTKGDLAALTGAVHFDVPKRAEQRTKDHTERYCVARLVATLPLSRLQFPLQLLHSDKPDFVLSMAGVEIGIEHTEVVPENIAHADFLRGKGHGPEIYFTQHASPAEPKKTGAEIIEEIEGDEVGDGWCGDSVEREWVVAMLHFVKSKAAKAQATGFLRFEHNWLLLYDNWPAPGLNFRKAAFLLAPLLAAENVYSVFDAIFVLDEQDMCEFNAVTFYAVASP